jgi:hypothetical protein
MLLKPKHVEEWIEYIEKDGEIKKIREGWNK